MEMSTGSRTAVWVSSLAQHASHNGIHPIIGYYRPNRSWSHRKGKKHRGVMHTKRQLEKWEVYKKGRELLAGDLSLAGPGRTALVFANREVTERIKNFRSPWK